MKKNKFTLAILFIACLFSGSLLISCGSASSSSSSSTTDDSTTTTTTSEDSITLSVTIPDSTLSTSGFSVSSISVMDTCDVDDGDTVLSEATVEFLHPLTLQNLSTSPDISTETDSCGQASFTPSQVSEEYFILRISKEVGDETVIVQSYIGDSTAIDEVDVDEASTLIANQVKKIAYDSGGALLAQADDSDLDDLDVDAEVAILTNIATDYEEYYDSSSSSETDEVDYTDLLVVDSTEDDVDLYQLLNAKSMFEDAYGTEIEDTIATDLATFTEDALEKVSDVSFSEPVEIGDYPDDFADDYSFVLYPEFNLPDGSVLYESVDIDDDVTELPDEVELYTELPSTTKIELGTGTKFREGAYIPEIYYDALPEDMEVEVGVDLPSSAILPSGASFEDEYIFPADSSFTCDDDFELPINIDFEEDFEMFSGDDCGFEDEFIMPDNIVYPEDMVIPAEVKYFEGDVDSTIIEYFDDDYEIYQDTLDKFASDVTIDDDIFALMHAEAAFKQAHIDMMEEIALEYAEKFDSEVVIDDSYEDKIPYYDGTMCQYIDYTLTDDHYDKIYEIDADLAEKLDESFVIDDGLADKLVEFDDTIYDYIDTESFKFDQDHYDLMAASDEFTFDESRFSEVIENMDPDATVEFKDEFFDRVADLDTIPAEEFEIVMLYMDEDEVLFDDDKIDMFGNIDGTLDSTYWDKAFTYMDDEVELPNEVFDEINEQGIDLDSEHVAFMASNMGSDVTLDDSMMDMFVEQKDAIDFTYFVDMMSKVDDGVEFDQDFIDHFSDEMDDFDGAVDPTFYEVVADRAGTGVTFHENYFNHMSQVDGTMDSTAFDMMYEKMDPNAELGEGFTEYLTYSGEDMPEDFFDKIDDELEFNEEFIDYYMDTGEELHDDFFDYVGQDVEFDEDFIDYVADGTTAVPAEFFDYMGDDVKLDEEFLDKIDWDNYSGDETQFEHYFDSTVDYDGYFYDENEDPSNNYTNDDPSGNYTGSDQYDDDYDDDDDVIPSGNIYMFELEIGDDLEYMYADYENDEYFEVEFNPLSYHSEATSTNPVILAERTYFDYTNTNQSGYLEYIYLYQTSDYIVELEVDITFNGDVPVSEPSLSSLEAMIADQDFLDYLPLPLIEDTEVDLFNDGSVVYEIGTYTDVMVFGEEETLLEITRYVGNGTDVTETRYYVTHDCYIVSLIKGDNNSD